MSISAAQVKELRELTGAGMMDCKAALTETNGNMEEAVDWLRKKGISKADKKAGRTAAEGLIGVDAGLREAVVVEVNSETDFVARNAALPGNRAQRRQGRAGLRRRDREASPREISGLRQDGHRDHQGRGRHDRREHVASAARPSCRCRTARVATYVHNAVADGLGKLGVLVAIETTGDAHKPPTPSRARSRCMSRRPTRCRSTSRQLDPAAVEREKAIFSEQARQSGKPENIIEKMVEGRLRKFYEEVVLLKQAFVLNPDLTVEKALKEAEKDIGAPAKITGYRPLRARRRHREGSHRLRGGSRGGGEEVTRHQPLPAHCRGSNRRAPRSGERNRRGAQPEDGDLLRRLPAAVRRCVGGVPVWLQFVILGTIVNLMFSSADVVCVCWPAR